MARVTQWMHWSPHPEGVFKLNTDGSRRNSRIAGAGGLIRNSNGEWVNGFSINLGVYSVTMAELWGIYQGLLLAWEIGIRDLLIEADSACAVQMIARDCFTVNACYPLICDIKGLMARNWRVAVHHFYRESNYVANLMASHALQLPLGLHIFSFPPSAISTWLLYDGLGISIPRRVIV